jgi:hypothetical protein
VPICSLAPATREPERQRILFISLTRGRNDGTLTGDRRVLGPPAATWAAVPMPLRAPPARSAGRVTSTGPNKADNRGIPAPRDEPGHAAATHTADRREESCTGPVTLPFPDRGPPIRWRPGPPLIRSPSGPWAPEAAPHPSESTVGSRPCLPPTRAVSLGCALGEPPERPSRDGAAPPVVPSSPRRRTSACPQQY